MSNSRSRLTSARTASRTCSRVFAPPSATPCGVARRRTQGGPRTRWLLSLTRVMSLATAPSAPTRSVSSLNLEQLSSEQRQELVARDTAPVVCVAERHVREGTLLRLKREDALFDGI